MDLIYVIASRNEHVLDMITTSPLGIYFLAQLLFQSSLANLNCKFYIYIYTVLYIMYEILQGDTTLNSRMAVRRNPTNHDVHRICHHSWLGKNMVKHPVLVLSLATHLPIISSVKPSGFNASEGIGYCSAVSTSSFQRSRLLRKAINPKPHLKNFQIAKDFFL